MGTGLEPIEPRYLRDQAFLQLREAIVSGALAPGAPIVIDDLAASFGLSAMPVREAVKRLVADGLVEELPRRAHRIVPLTRTSALHVIEIAETLIVRAYELGVGQLEPSEIGEMRVALERAGDAARAGDLTLTLAAIHDFHGVVYAATGNPEFERLIATVVPRFDRVLRLWYEESLTEVATSYRREVLLALEQRRPEQAVALVREAWRSFRVIVGERAEER